MIDPDSSKAYELLAQEEVRVAASHTYWQDADNSILLLAAFQILGAAPRIPG